jgi:beta-galactosidase
MNCPLRLSFLKFIPLGLLLGSLTPNFLTAQTATPQTTTPDSAPATTPPITNITPDGKPHKFEARDHQFFIDGQPTMLISGEMHFGRVQPEDWDTRIKQAKAMGLNTISCYLFWNQVEPEEGKFDFTGMTDVRRVLKLCQDNGMWCILRPGPYCCAEIEYGGIPYWTLKYPDVKIRTADPKFLGWCKDYINEVYKQVADFQVSKGGPLLMVQIDNEYGITDPQAPDGPGNNNYMVELSKIFKDAGFDCQLFVCDPTHAPEWTDPSYRIPGVMICRNGLKDDAGFQLSADAIGNYPVFVPEVYTAWFSGWGEPIATRNGTIPQITNWVNYLLDHQYSFNLYLFFGGTNYGFDNGCNFFEPVQTSYDYLAPVDEAGRTTPKYYALRDLLSKRLNLKLPDPPAEPTVITLPPIELNETEPLLATLPATPTLVADKPVSMESLDQDYGFVDYHKQFPNGLKGTLELKDAQDYSIVMVNGITVGEAFRGLGLDSNKIAVDQTGPATLDILVYNLGRISVVTNDRTQNLARKGLLGGATLDGQELTGWDMYSLPYPEGPDNFKAMTHTPTGPTFYRGTFTVDKLGGTFLDLADWSFGVVWVNGHNLGRFWDRGGLRSLFVPQQWLNEGENEIVALELHDAPKVAKISGGTKIIEEPAEKWAVKLDAPPTF